MILFTLNSATSLSMRLRIQSREHETPGVPMAAQNKGMSKSKRIDG